MKDRPLRPHQTLLVRFSIAALSVVLLAAVGFLVLIEPFGRARLLGGVERVTREFHDDNARLHRAAVEKLGSRTRSELEDVPFELFGDDHAALRAFLDERSRAAEERAVRNSEAFADFYHHDLDARIAASATEEAARLRTGMALGFALLVAVLLAAQGIALYRLVLGPIHRMRRATESIGAGDLETRVPADATTELGRLGASFNRMVEELKASRDEVTEWNRTLERRVEAARDRVVQSEKMASLGRLAGGFAHEFNNLLGGILGVAQAAAHDDDLDEIRESLDVIERTAGRAALVSRNLLRFSRPGTARPTGQADVVGVLRDAVRLAEIDAAKRGVTMTLDAPNWLAVPGRDDEIHQVALNLILNAIQACDRGGHVSITLAESDDEAVLAVEDTGPGVPEAIRARVFEPFFTTRDGPTERGTGLGLAVSYGIVSAMGGRIEIVDAPEREGRPGGARFEVHLPQGAEA